MRDAEGFCDNLCPTTKESRQEVIWRESFKTVIKMLKCSLIQLMAFGEGGMGLSFLLVAGHWKFDYDLRNIWATHTGLVFIGGKGTQMGV